jgi:esterase/lipase
MIFSTDYLSNLYIEKFQDVTASKDAVLFLHGYPANIGCKNRDLADFISKELLVDTFLIHYSGLGNSSGNFSFSNSVIDVNTIIEYIKKMGYSKIHFIGHSWGGYLTLRLSPLWDNDSKIILLSPFIHFPKEHEFNLLVSHIYKETSPLLSPMSENEVFDDLVKIRLSEEEMISTIQQLNNKIVLIQAQNDDETPRHHAENFSKLLQDQVEYHEINTDHSFTTNRELLKETLLSSMRK